MAHCSLNEILKLNLTTIKISENVSQNQSSWDIYMPICYLA